jgi:hypothetical protein
MLTIGSNFQNSGKEIFILQVKLNKGKLFLIDLYLCGHHKKL